MAYVGDSDNIMRPNRGSRSLLLPVTFDYNGGKEEFQRNKVIWVVAVVVIGVFIGLALLLSKDKPLYLGILYSGIVLFITSFIVRFVLLKEHIIRNNMASKIKSDLKRPYSDFWKSYSIDEEYPYIVRLKNGKKVIFVRYDKDVVIGKGEDFEFDHSEAIGDAYNLVSYLKLGMIHMDYMDTVGRDVRLDNCFKTVSEVEGDCLRELLTSIYVNLKENTEDNVCTFDVYAYSYSGTDNAFWYNLGQVISCMLEANYLGFTVLDSSEHRQLVQNLLNLEDFSITEAESSLQEKSKGVIPIRVDKKNGEVILLNKTVEDKKIERELKAKEDLLTREEAKRRKLVPKSKKSDNDSDIDIFD